MVFLLRGGGVEWGRYKKRARVHLRCLLKPTNIKTLDALLLHCHDFVSGLQANREMVEICEAALLTEQTFVEFYSMSLKA